jgi:type IV secretion system protein VirB3
LASPVLRLPPQSSPQSLLVAERSPLFLGLGRPPKLLGLPIMYAMVWLFGSVLLFVWVQHIVILGVAIVLYPLLWKAADWDPRFIDVMMTALQETPPTRNRQVHSGDSYAP